MTIKEIIHFLEQKAPPIYQESYDNSGLIVGNKDNICTGALICLDSIESIVYEALEKKCNLIVAHHPIVFSGLKSLTGKNYIERVIIKAIKHDIAIYAIHTNLDNVRHGVNQKIADQLDLTDTRILFPKQGLLKKLALFVPKTHLETVRDAIFDSGAGNIGSYDQCSFNTEGIGTFRPQESAQPFKGDINKRHLEEEIKLEVVFEPHLQSNVLKAIEKSHPYETVAYDLFNLNNKHSEIGSGMIGKLKEPISKQDFLQHLKNKLQAEVIRYTKSRNPMVETVALCGGSGSFLLSNAMAAKADVFVTADFKYHQFFDAEQEIMICDIGHYETEHFTIQLLGSWIMEKFPKFAVHFTEISTNPINYF